MSYSVSAAITAKMTVTETLGDASLSSTLNKVTHNWLDTVFTLNGGSTPEAAKVVSMTKALSSGAGTIDLTSMVGTNGSAVTFSGLKLQGLFVKNPSTHNITITTGASNGYTLSTIVVTPGGQHLMTFNDGLIDVDGTHKTLDLSGTSADTLQISMLAG